ncbi:MAG: hypothetical protein ACK5BV_06750 [Bacteroidota bacterium]
MNDSISTRQKYLLRCKHRELNFTTIKAIKLNDFHHIIIPYDQRMSIP